MTCGAKLTSCFACAPYVCQCCWARSPPTPVCVCVQRIEYKLSDLRYFKCPIIDAKCSTETGRSGFGCCVLVCVCKTSAALGASLHAVLPSYNVSAWLDNWKHLRCRRRRCATHQQQVCTLHHHPEYTLTHARTHTYTNSLL